MRNNFKEWAPVIGLMLLAGVLRLYAIGTWPPGLYHDEAFNGLDALRVLGGQYPLYFAANHGREPFFIYLVALSVQLLGRTVVAVRLPAAILGILTIPATYWMGRELFNRRIGLFTAAIVAVTLWPIHLSRIGFRAVALPLFVGLCIAAGVRAYRSGRTRDWVIAGVLYGASFYTYLASRFTPLVLVLFVVVLVLSRRTRRMASGLVPFALATAVTLAPLAVTAITQWDVVMGRLGDVSIFNPGVNHGDLLGTAIGNTLKAAGMFFWQGDGIPRHNVPYRPVFDPILALAFGLGLIRLIYLAIRARVPSPLNPRLPEFLSNTAGFETTVTPATLSVANPLRLPAVFTLLWIGVMLLPTILAEDAPHFLRAVGILPVAMIVPAVGLGAVADWLMVHSWRGFGIGVTVAAIVVAGVFTVRDYSRYAVDPETGYAFEAASAQLAAEAQSAGSMGKQVFIADRFMRDWTSISFLLNGSYQTIPDGGQPSVQRGSPAVLFLWPYEDFTQMMNALPAPTQLQVEAGPLARGDLDPQPHVAYLMVQAEPEPEVAGSPEAQFENGLRLLGHSIEVVDDRHWRLRTLWQAETPQSADETFFVHLLLAGKLIVSADGDPGGGFYPANLWRAGDVIIDERTIELPVVDSANTPKLLIEMGVYRRSTNQRVQVLQSAQPVIDQAILLGGPGIVGP